MASRFLFLFIFILTAHPVWAVSAGGDNEVRQFYTGARAYGMGGASIAVVNDETALLSNPAALGKLREFYGTIIDPEIEGGASFNSLYNAGLSGFFDPNAVEPAMVKQGVSDYHAKGQVFPSLVFKNFGIGIYARQSLDAHLDSTGTKMQTFMLDDQALLMGFSLRFFDGRIKIGLTGKAISRIQVDKNLDTSGDMTLATNETEGVGLGGDMGLILAAPWTYIPTLAFVAHDMGGTSFEAGSGIRATTTGRPNKLEQDYDVAFALFPIHGNTTRSAITVEEQNVLAAGKAKDKTRYFHAGYEFNWGDIFFLRAGMNQKYWTAGLELASENTQIQITSYGEDIGPDGASQEDRRLVFKFSLRF